MTKRRPRQSIREPMLAGCVWVLVSQVAWAQGSGGCEADYQCDRGQVCQAGTCAEATTCSNDNDCPGELICDRKVCRVGEIRSPAPPPSTPPPTAPAVQRAPDAKECKGLGRPEECPPRHQCYYFRCVPNDQVPDRDIEEETSTRLALTNLFGVGVAGELGRSGTAYAIGIDFTIPVSRRLQWHFEVAYLNTVGLSGLRGTPLSLGFPIPIYEGKFRIEVEIVLAAAEIEWVAKLPAGYLAMSLALRPHVNASYGPAYISIVPFGFEMRYMKVFWEGPGKDGDPVVATGFGLDFPIMFNVGLEL